MVHPLHAGWATELATSRKGTEQDGNPVHLKGAKLVFLTKMWQFLFFFQDEGLHRGAREDGSADPRARQEEQPLDGEGEMQPYVVHSSRKYHSVSHYFLGEGKKSWWIFGLCDFFFIILFFFCLCETSWCLAEWARKKTYPACEFSFHCHFLTVRICRRFAFLFLSCLTTQFSLHWKS